MTEPAPSIARPRPVRVRTADRSGRRPAVLAALALTLALLLPPVTPSPAAAQSADGFDDRLVASVPLPTALAFLPDGRMLITSKGGELSVLQPGSNTPSTALDLSGTICTDGERGLLGVAVDPAFAQGDNFVYLYYTKRTGGACANQVSRFPMTGDTVDRDSEDSLLQNIPSPATNHNAGDVQFGKDGKLYVSIGDGANPRLAPAPSIVNGKILRINPDGTTPNDNPYARLRQGRPCADTGRVAATQVCTELYARGLRNPFRMAFDPDAVGTTFFINDVGAGTWEEIDVGIAGANYGWPRREGPCPTGKTRRCGKQPRGTTRPIHAYRHSTGCRSITGGAFVPNDANTWPQQFRNSYLYADFVCDRVFAFNLDVRRVTWVRPTTGSPIALAFGPEGDRDSLYYATFASEEGQQGPPGQIRRLSPTGAAPADPAPVDAAAIDTRQRDATARGADPVTEERGDRRQRQDEDRGDRRQRQAEGNRDATATETPTPGADEPNRSRRGSDQG